MPPPNRCAVSTPPSGNAAQVWVGTHHAPPTTHTAERVSLVITLFRLVEASRGYWPGVRLSWPGGASTHRAVGLPTRKVSRGPRRRCAGGGAFQKHLHKLTTWSRSLRSTQCSRSSARSCWWGGLGQGARGILDIASIRRPRVESAPIRSVQIAGDPRKVNDFLELVRPYGLIELVKSGRVALAREPKGRPAKLRAVT